MPAAATATEAATASPATTTAPGLGNTGKHHGQRQREHSGSSSRTRHVRRSHGRFHGFTSPAAASRPVGGGSTCTANGILRASLAGENRKVVDRNFGATFQSEKSAANRGWPGASLYVMTMRSGSGVLPAAIQSWKSTESDRPATW